MKKIRMPLALIAIFMMFSGCASYGPVTTPDFAPKVRHDMPEILGEFVYQSPGVLSRGTDGYKYWSMVYPKAKDAGGHGVILLTDRGMHFLRWAGDKYFQIWEAKYSKIVSVEIRSLGLGRRIVLDIDDEEYMTSIDVATDSGQRIDKERTKKVCEIVASYINSDCKYPK